MGLIRKSLNLGTAGLVRPESKKQRYARTAAGIPSQYEKANEGWRALGAALTTQPQAGPPGTGVPAGWTLAKPARRPRSRGTNGRCQRCGRWPLGDFRADGSHILLGRKWCPGDAQDGGSEWRAEHVPGSKEYRARHPQDGESGMPYREPEPRSDFPRLTDAQYLGLMEIRWASIDCWAAAHPGAELPAWYLARKDENHGNIPPEARP
jgi:hypothetical protein